MSRDATGHPVVAAARLSQNHLKGDVPRGLAMITDEKLTVYQRFGGDIDGWALAATPHEKALLTDEDWADISEILLRIAVVKSGQAADVYDAETKRIIASKVENEGVAKRLDECALTLGVQPRSARRSHWTGPDARASQDTSAAMRFREASAAEADSVLRIHRLAFRREDEAELVAKLLLDPSAQPSLSLLADAQGEHVGHVLFTALRLVGTSGPVSCALLAPLAVLPSHQRSGVGRDLIEHGCKVLAGRGIKLVFVLGDPRYYTRCGFRPAVPSGLHAPYPIEPEEAWMVRALYPGVLGVAHGTVQCAQSLAAAEYWRE